MGYQTEFSSKIVGFLCRICKITAEELKKSQRRFYSAMRLFYANGALFHMHVKIRFNDLFRIAICLYESPVHNTEEVPAVHPM